MGEEIKSSEKKSKLPSALVILLIVIGFLVVIAFVVMFVGIVIWQLGLFNNGHVTVTYTGFARIKPQLAATGVTSDGQFTGVFTNGVGTEITINGGQITDRVNPSYGCSLTPDMFDPSVLRAGENTYLITPNNCLSPPSPGDVYLVEIELNYDVSIAGVTTTHSDKGTIRGIYE